MIGADTADIGFDFAETKEAAFAPFGSHIDAGQGGL